MIILGGKLGLGEQMLGEKFFLAAGSTYACENILEGRRDRRLDPVELAFCMSKTFELGHTS